jgi:SAM-dependent methyltransferase
MDNADYCCPRCRGSLDAWAARYECRACGRMYPIIAGIPDFRIYADPYIGIKDDRAKGLRLHQAAASRSFAELVGYYYAITPEVTPDQARRFQAHHIAGVTRGWGMLDRLTRYGLVTSDRLAGRWLDLGCGTAGFLAAANCSALSLVGVDIAFRWLVIAQRRLDELGRSDIRLVCACADHLPFPDHYFDLVVAESLLEHTSAPGAVLAEVGRVRRARSAFMARTVNRYAPAPEPHVGVWGVGFLPRRLMNPYVRWRKGISYQHITLQSARSLRQLARAAGQTDLTIRCPLLSRADYQHHSPAQQRIFTLYHALAAGVPALRPLLALASPYLDIASRPAADS